VSCIAISLRPRRRHGEERRHSSSKRCVSEADWLSRTRRIQRRLPTGLDKAASMIERM